MMNMIQKRFIMFLVGCIGVRTILAFLARAVPLYILPYLGLVALLPVFGWIYIFLTNSRTTGPEVLGGTIWWNSLRIPHAILYMLFALFALQQKPSAWYFLLADVILGLISFIFYHYTSGNFAKLFN